MLVFTLLKIPMITIHTSSNIGYVCWIYDFPMPEVVHSGCRIALYISDNVGKKTLHLQKQILYDHLEQADLKLVFMVMYTHSEIMNYKELESKILALLLRLKKEVKNNT